MQKNNTEKVKYLIIGQGLVGTWMSYYLDKAGISYKVINDASIKSASSVASGVMNPVTGRRIVQTWMIETILPFAVTAYKAMEDKLNIKILKTAPIILIHPSEQMKESFDFRMNHENVYLFNEDKNTWSRFFKLPFGIGAINECYWIDLNLMIQHWNDYLRLNNRFMEAHFDADDICFHENSVSWKNLEADKIIFCDGVNSMKHSFFKSLPFAPNKGEALIIKVPGLPNKHIYKNNVSVVPWEEDLFWVGSSYEWTYDHVQPSIEFREKVIQSLLQFMELPFEVVDQVVGIRPANTQRRPFIGLHPLFPQLAICNGMGTKGCSLAPYFTHELMEHLENQKAINTEADINRFASILKEVK